MDMDLLLCNQNMLTKIRIMYKSQRKLWNTRHLRPCIHKMKDILIGFIPLYVEMNVEMNFKCYKVFAMGCHCTYSVMKIAFAGFMCNSILDYYPFKLSFQ